MVKNQEQNTCTSFFWGSRVPDGQTTWTWRQEGKREMVVRSQGQLFPDQLCATKSRILCHSPSWNRACEPLPSNEGCGPAFLCWMGATYQGGTCEVGGPTRCVTERTRDIIASPFSFFLFFFLRWKPLYHLPQVRREHRPPSSLACKYETEDVRPAGV